jgi:hypothetical protein
VANVRAQNKADKADARAATAAQINACTPEEKEAVSEAARLDQLDNDFAGVANNPAQTILLEGARLASGRQCRSVYTDEQMRQKDRKDDAAKRAELRHAAKERGEATKGKGKAKKRKNLDAPSAGGKKRRKRKS